MISLTAVIPVSTTLIDVSNLEVNIAGAMKNGISTVIVIDSSSNASNPALEDLCDKFLHNADSLQIVRGKYGSPGKARNAGFGKVRSEFVVFWDADDLVNVPVITAELEKHGVDCDYIVGSYEIVEIVTGLKRQIYSHKLFRRMRLIWEPAIWRIMFRTINVQECFFGTSSMGEDQLFLVNSGVLGSRKSYFSKSIFYSYSKGIHGQLTSRNELNSDLRHSISEIFSSNSTTGIKNNLYRYLILQRVVFTLVKRVMSGKK